MIVLLGIFPHPRLVARRWVQCVWSGERAQFELLMRRASKLAVVQFGLNPDAELLGSLAGISS